MPRSPSIQQIDDEVATTSSSPALLTRRLRAQRHVVAAELLHDREQTGVEEADLEQHQERQRAVDAVGQRVEDGDREVEAEAALDQRLRQLDLVVLLALPVVRVALDAVLRGPGELAAFLVHQRL